VYAGNLGELFKLGKSKSVDVDRGKDALTPPSVVRIRFIISGDSGFWFRIIQSRVVWMKNVDPGSLILDKISNE
jgi:hypothetical protein